MTNTPTEVELRKVIADYESRINEIADLIAHVRHELNNPLTAVLGQAQLLLREDLSERARKRVATIEELAMRLRDITSRLREVQRLKEQTEGKEPPAEGEEPPAG